MDLKLYVVFECCMSALDCDSEYTKHFSTLPDLQRAVNSFRSDFFTLQVSRIVKIVDRDSKKTPNGMSQFFIPQGKQYETVAFTPEKITFTVATKLMYPHDVRKLLMKKYNSVFNFNNISLDENIPVKDFYVSEQNSFGLKNPDTSDIYFNWVICEQCGPTNFVVDKRLRQTWPQTTPDILFPQELLKLLSKKTEKVH